MSESNLLCDQCGQEAAVFSLQPPFKVKACRTHAVHLMEKHFSVFSIAAYNFIECAEDYAEYEARTDIVSQCQLTLSTLQQRNESSRTQAHSRLQSVQKTVQETVERSFQELGRKVDLRFELVQAELKTLSESLEKYKSDKVCTLSPALKALQCTCPGDLFKVAVGDNSLLLVKNVLEGCLLLPEEAGLPRTDTADKLMAKALTLTERADLAEEVSAYALELGCKDSNSDLKKAANQMRRKAAKEMLRTLPLNFTEEYKRTVAELYRQAGEQARAKGDYARSLKKLERGSSLLQQWGLDSPETSLALCKVLAHFGKRQEPCEILRLELQRSLSSDQSLRLYNGLIEIHHLAGQLKEVTEVAEQALKSSVGCSNSFEQLKVLYFLADSLSELKNVDKGLELVNYWTHLIVAETEESKFALQFVCAEKELGQGNKEEAARLYEEGLQGFELLHPDDYLTLNSRHRLASIYEGLQLLERAASHLDRNFRCYSLHFPQSVMFTFCLQSLARLYALRKEPQRSEATYLQATMVLATHYPESLHYPVCLSNLAEQYTSMNLFEKAETTFSQAHRLFSVRFPECQEFAESLSNLVILLYSTSQYQAAETHYKRAMAIYSAHYPQSSQFATSLHRIGRLHQGMENMEIAKKHYLHANRIFSAHFPVSLEYATCLVNLGFLLYSTSEFKAAEPCYLKAIDICSAHYPHSMELANCFTNLALLCCITTRNSKAETHYLQAVRIFSVHFPDSYNFASCLQNLGKLYESLNQLDKTQTYYSQAIEIYSAHFPLSSPYAICLFNLGFVQANVGKRTMAVHNVEAALKVFTHNKEQEDVVACKTLLKQLRRK